MQKKENVTDNRDQEIVEVKPICVYAKLKVCSRLRRHLFPFMSRHYFENHALNIRAVTHIEIFRGKGSRGSVG